MVEKGLHGLAEKAREMGDFKSLRLSLMVEFSLLQYADDSIIIGEPYYGNLLAVKAILCGFELVSGLRVNFLKSSFFSFYIEEGFMDIASNFLHCSLSNVLFQYLGILIGVSPRRALKWEPVVSSFRRRLGNWKICYLSLGGRITLINSMLSSLPLYFFLFLQGSQRVL